MLSQSFGAGGHCGTMQFVKNLKSPPKKALAYLGCTPESLYEGKVDTAKTQHFIIYYKKTGYHAAKSAFIDSLKVYLEQAYKLHKDSLGMKELVGVTQTYHYNQRVPAGLYPIEVLDIGLLRGNEGNLRNVFGLTLPSRSKASQIIIENDFLYGAECNKASTSPFISTTTGKNYAIDWDLALKVTTFHELYHGFQMTYFNILSYDTFWLEASAVGVEEIGAPEVDDYIGYLYNVFQRPGKSIETLYEEDTDGRYGYAYGYASLYLFLSKLDPKFDSYIWDSFSKFPREKFSVHLARYANSIGRDAEELFHEYAKGVFFSGRSRASLQQAPAFLFWPDQYMWPTWETRSMTDASRTRVLPYTAIDFIRVTSAGRQPSIDSATISLLDYGDSSIWILSRLLEAEYVPPAPQKSFAAYPNPWNPKKSDMHFGNLPSKATGVEIRSANGALIERISLQDNADEEKPLIWKPKNLPAPGILYYRFLPSGKNKVLIVQW
jgi:hypothetical protein